MDQRNVERLFVTLMSQIDKKYEEECNMCIDVFLEEECSVDECKRMLLYLLDKVKEDKKEMVKERLERSIGPLEDAIK